MKVFLIIFFVSLANLTWAQDDAGEPKRPLQKIIIAYFTKQLSLTEAESKEFWPIYKEFRKEMKSATKGNDDDEIKRNEAILAVQKKYKPKFVTVLKTEERANKVFTLHRTLAQEIKKRVKELRGKKGKDSSV